MFNALKGVKRLCIKKKCSDKRLPLKIDIRGIKPMDKHVRF